MYVDEGLQAKNSIGWLKTMKGFYAAALAVALLALLPRMVGHYYLGKYLWAEDGNIFLNQAQDLGLAAITEPYNGYLHFYPRFVTAFAQLFTFAYQPTVLLLGWIAAYLIMMHALVRATAKAGESMPSIAVLLALSSLQPNFGEVFFNITNSQWMLGAALSIYALAGAGTAERKTGASGLLLFPLAITGPFSIILAPVLFMKGYFANDWKRRKYVYLSVFAGALVQVAILSHNERTASGPMDKDPEAWVSSFVSLSLFGANTRPTIAAAVLFWSIIAYLIVKQGKQRRYSDLLAEPGLLLLGAAILMILAGLFSYKHNPRAIIALAGGNRYTWIPYVLILAAAFMLSHAHKMHRTILALLFAFICAANFHRVDSPKLQFESFARYARSEPVMIPILPQWPSYPGFYVMGKPDGTPIAQPPVTIAIDPQAFTVSGLSLGLSGAQLTISSTGQDPQLTLKQKLTCPASSHAGVDVYMTRKEDGWMQLFWNAEGNYSEGESLRRWYPAGRIRAQFAFPMPAGGIHLRFDPMENEGQATIEKIELRCL